MNPLPASSLPADRKVLFRHLYMGPEELQACTRVVHFSPYINPSISSVCQSHHPSFFMCCLSLEFPVSLRSAWPASVSGAGLRSVWLQQRLRVAWEDSFTTSPITADSETGTRSLPRLWGKQLYTGNWHKWGSYNFLSDEVGKPDLIRIWQKDWWCLAAECRNWILKKKKTWHCDDE